MSTPMRYMLAGLDGLTPPGFHEYVMAEDYDRLRDLHETLTQHFQSVTSQLAESQEKRLHNLELCEKAQDRLERIMAKHGY